MRTVIALATLSLLLAACAGEEETKPAAARPAGVPGSPAVPGPAEAEAAAHGVDFVASGHAPDWHLQLDEERRITFTAADFAVTDIALPAPAAVIDGTGRRIYRADNGAHALTLLLTEASCQDAKTGERFPMAASVMLDGRLFQGCGRVLAAAAQSKPTAAEIESWVGKRLVRIGEEAGARPGDVLERDLPQPYRVFAPGTMGDMMFNPDRLNLAIDAQSVITRVYWG